MVDPLEYDHHSKIYHFYYIFKPFFLGGHEYQVQVKSRSLASHYLGEESEAKNIELFAEYNANGIPGYGIVEWNYRNLKSIK